MSRDLSTFLNPASVAIIGVSENPTKVGSIVLKNLISSGYKGRIFAINSRLSHLGLMKFFPAINSLPIVPDLVAIAISAAHVIDEVVKSAEFGVKNFIIYSSGFKEIGTEGETLEKKLIEVSQKYNLNILGPNCLGLLTSSLNLTFGSAPNINGNLKIISQSGAIISSILKKVSLDTCLSLGNKAVLNENDFLDNFSKTPTPLGLYLESISDGQEFIKAISRFTPNHPIFVLKPNQSPQSDAALRSHTGSIATPDFIFDAALSSCGAIRCSNLADFFELSQIISQSKIPSGPRVAIVTNAGGPAVMATDAIIKSGLQMAELSSSNPVDLLGDASPLQFEETLQKLSVDPGVDAIIVIVTPQSMTDIEGINSVVKKVSQVSSTPIFPSFIPEVFPESLIVALSSLWRWQQWRHNQSRFISLSLPNETLDSTFSTSPTNQLPQNLLSALKIPTPHTSFITTLDEATKFAQDNSYPLVLKISTDKILHKTEVGGVVLNINNLDELTAAFNNLISVSSVLQIQSQIDNGVEIILGFKRDPTFGPTILFGAGGKLAEVISDRNLSLLPLTSNALHNLVSKSHVIKLLSGFRGDAIYNLDPLYLTIQTLGQLFLDYPHISEMEINPLVVTHQGVYALDPKVIMK